jgi:tetratricopeptide (TPR) repeat protein
MVQEKLEKTFRLNYKEPKTVVALPENRSMRMNLAQAIASEHKRNERWYAQGHFTMGLTYQKDGIYAAAEEEYYKALAIHPDYYDCYINLALLLHEQGMVDKAVEKLREAIAIHPDRRLAHINLAKMFYAQGFYNEALEAAQTAADSIRGKDDPEVLDVIGKIHYERRDYKAATEFLDKVLCVDPLRTTTRSLLALIQMKTKDYASCADNLKRIIEQDPINFEALNNLGLIYYKRGMYYEAIKQLKRAVSSQPSRAEAHKNLGNIYLDKKMIGRALAEFRRYLKTARDTNERVKVVALIEKLEKL